MCKGTLSKYSIDKELLMRSLDCLKGKEACKIRANLAPSLPVGSSFLCGGGSLQTWIQGALQIHRLLIYKEVYGKGLESREDMQEEPCGIL